jgi:hypothetical protein
VLSIGIEALYKGVPLSLVLVSKWIVFWAVGWRLFLAGLRQVLQPSYTAREIFGLKGEESLVLVKELGFANIAIGVVAVLSLVVPAWRNAAALAGGIFYGLAGINHALQSHRSRRETVAIVSDLLAAAALLVICVVVMASASP